MDYSKFFLYASPAEAGPRYSLRLRGAQYLLRTNKAPSFGQQCTLSFWWKDSSYSTNDVKDSALINSALSWPPTSGDQMLLRITDTSAFNDGRILSCNNDQTNAGGLASVFNCASAIRDYSGWYHIVMRLHSNEDDPADRVKFWINGKLEPYTNSGADPRKAEVNALNTDGCVTQIGKIVFPSGTEVFGHGYLADVHFVDGSAPDASAFGEYDENGVWIPKDYEGSYGNNGYFLKFDPSTVFPTSVKDSSGNTNSFSLFNFSFNTGVDEDLVEDHPTRNFPTQNPLQMIFKGGSTSDVGTKLSDANLTSYDSTAFTNSTSTFALPKTGTQRYYAECTITTVGLTGVGVCDINAGNDVSRYNTNNMVYGSGGTINLPGGVGTQPYGETYGDGDIIGLEYNSANRDLTFYKNGVSQGVAYNPLPEDVDFCIHDDLAGHTVSWNYGQRPFSYQPDGTKAFASTNLPQAPIPNGRDHFAAITGPGVGTFTDTVENVTYTTGQNYTNTATYSGDIYSRGWEPAFDGNPDAYVYSGGLGESYTATWNPPIPCSTVQIYGNTANFECKIFVNGQNAGGDAQVTEPLRWLNVLDVSAQGGIQSITFEDNGTYNASIGLVKADDTILVDDARSAHIKFATDKNFSAFSVGDTIRVSGSGSTNYATITNIVPGEMSYMEVTNVQGDIATGEICYLEGVGDGILGLARQNYNNGFWWIKDRQNDNQHQIVDSVRGQVGGNWQAQLCPERNVAPGDYVAPSGDSVAWCWGAPDTWTNSTGTGGAQRDSNGRRNTAAGFSIINWSDGNGTNDRVGHGLDAMPWFVLYGLQVNAGSLGCMHFDGTQWRNGTLNRNDALSNNTTELNPDATTISNFQFQDNDTGMMGYAWEPIPGYSAFGSFTGNADADGPFIYTGFKPAFVMIKCVAAGNWVMFDTTRSPHNLTDTVLYPNLTNSEDANLGDGIDLLSNGFKARSNWGAINGSASYVYVAFAERPFAGANVNPANAR